MAENGSNRLAWLRGLFSVNIRMLPIKISYLLYGGVLGSHLPYLTVFFTSIGLSETQAGLIAGLRFAPSSIAGPLWGMMADYTGRRKLIVTLLCLGSAFPLFSMPFVAHAINPNPHSGETNSTSLNPHAMYNAATNGLHKHTNTSTLFYTMLFIMILGSVFVGPLPAFIDSLVMNVVKNGDTDATYGAQRIFGSLGFSIASLIAGVAADNYKDPHLSKYTAVFFIYLPSALVLIPFGYYLVNQTRWDNEENNEDDEKTNKNEANEEGSNGGGRGMIKQILHELLKVDVIVFLITVLISGFACNMFNSFAFMLAGDVLTASETELSFIFFIATFAEVILFPFTTKLLKLLGGESVCITLGIFSYFVRFLVMSYTTQLWIMLSIQVLHAVGFALAWAAMMEYLHVISPKEIVMSMFLIFQSIMFGVAALLANTVCGYIYEVYGGQKLFRGKAILCGVWTVVLVLYYGYQRFTGKNAIRNENPVEFSSRPNGELKDEETIEIGVDNVVTTADEVTTHCN